MRKVLALVVAVVFVASAIPVFAGGDACVSIGKDKCKVNVKLPFQIIADTMTVGKAKPKNQLRPILQKVETFQEASDTIGKVSKSEK